MGKLAVQKKRKDEGLIWFWGCGGLIVASFFVVAFLLLFAISRDRENAQYPGSIPISSHSNYTGLPYEFRWDDAYRVEDNFTAVYQWYSLTFNLGAESRAMSGCIQLDGEMSQLLLKRSTIVLLCATGEEQMVFITRSTAVIR